MELFVKLSEKLGELALEQKAVIATAESCTAGGIACAITQIPGSSEWFDRGFVTYSNQSKEDLLGVDHETLLSHGAVSAETVSEMVQGALARSAATMAVAVSGIAGPGGAVPGKPVGTLALAVACGDKVVSTRITAGTQRERNIERFTHTALLHMVDLLHP